MELNMGFRNTLVVLNTHRVEDGRQLVGHNAVMNIFDRMALRVDIISKIPQRNVNHDTLRVARKNHAKQFLVMSGDLTEEALMKKHPQGIPSQYNPKQLPQLSRNQVIFMRKRIWSRREGPQQQLGTKYFSLGTLPDGPPPPSPLL